MKEHTLTVIGGGPAGIMAAITAASMGIQVTILEKMEKPGKKLLITGRGRCNLSNTHMDTSHYHSGKRNFVRDVLSKFGLEETLAFFKEVGIPVKTEKEGKIIPQSEQAASVLEILLMELKDLGVPLFTDHTVKKITLSKSGFRLQFQDKEEMKTDALILATGGKSYPGLGSTGDGYALAVSLGHSIIDPRPALVHVKCDTPYLKHINGNKFIGTAHLWLDQKKVRSYSGEILFTDYGLSGIPLLQLSRSISEGLEAKQAVRVTLDLYPDYSVENLIQILNDRIRSRPNRSAGTFLTGFLHSRLIPIVLQECGLTKTGIPCASLQNKQVKELAHFLKAWPFTPTGTRGWDVAQVTAGGINVREVDSQSLQSRITKGLFFAGEVLDVDGECGGYNLQWAWSSGFTAGCYAAQFLEDRL